jgi:branched-chain amino acid transport system substrate-binding protein
MKEYAPDAAIDNPAVDGYTSGKLLEAALATVSAKARSGPITTALIIEGLNKVKGETLQGLAPSPITFTAGKPHAPITCYFTVLISKSGFSDPNKGKPACL